MEVIADFQTWMLSIRRPQTARNRVHYARQLMKWCDNDRLSIFDLSAKQISQWLLSVGQSPATRKNALDAINVFYKWAVMSRYTTTNPAAEIPKIMVPQGMPNPTPDDVLQQGIDRCESVQDLLMLLFASYGGLRVGEIALLHSHDIHDGQVRVQGKGGKIRYIPLHPTIRDILHQANIDGWLFPSTRNPSGHYLPDSIAQRIRKHLLPGKWSAHSLRHRFATEFYHKNLNILALRELLGHATVSSTMIYTRVSSDALAPQVAAIQDQGAARRWSVIKTDPQ